MKRIVMQKEVEGDQDEGAVVSGGWCVFALLCSTRSGVKPHHYAVNKNRIINLRVSTKRDCQH